MPPRSQECRTRGEKIRSLALRDSMRADRRALHTIPKRKRVDSQKVSFAIASSIIPAHSWVEIRAKTEPISLQFRAASLSEVFAAGAVSGIFGVVGTGDDSFNKSPTLSANGHQKII